MKISIIEDDSVQDTEITIRCRKMNAELEQIISRISLTHNTVTGVADGETYFIPLGHIYYFDSVDGKTFIYCDGTEYESPLRLYQIEEELARECFSRISKSTIVNLRKVKSIKPEEHSRLIATLVNGEKLVVSRQYVKEIKKVLGV